MDDGPADVEPGRSLGLLSHELPSRRRSGRPSTRRLATSRSRPPTWRASTTSRRSWASPTTCSATARPRSRRRSRSTSSSSPTPAPTATPRTRRSARCSRVTRQWNDADADFIPDCDLVNPLQNGECLQITNLAFGNPVPSTTYDPDILRGWGKRGYNWETSVSVQHELMLERVGRRRLLPPLVRQLPRHRQPCARAGRLHRRSPSTAPTDARLPDGGGQPVSGLFNVTQAASRARRTIS